jgi:hypothetical protein
MLNRAAMAYLTVAWHFANWTAFTFANQRQSIGSYIIPKAECRAYANTGAG